MDHVQVFSDGPEDVEAPLNVEGDRTTNLRVHGKGLFDPRVGYLALPDAG